MGLWGVTKKKNFFRLLAMFPSPMEKTLQMKMDLTLLIYPSFSLLNVHAFCSYEMRVLLAYISLSKAHKAISFCVSVSLLFILMVFISHFTWTYVVYNLTMKKVVFLGEWPTHFIQQIKRSLINYKAIEINPQML